MGEWGNCLCDYCDCDLGDEVMGEPLASSLEEVARKLVFNCHPYSALSREGGHVTAHWMAVRREHVIALMDVCHPQATNGSGS